MVYVRVPATSANMGPGFDSLGIALGMYNTLKISEIDSGIVVYNNSKEYIPIGEKNLVYRAICRVFDEVGYEKKGIKIIQNSDIPVTRGLGSSSACIIGGMLAANVFSGRKLSYSQILNLAAEFEGHPDNVTPALFGGFCVAATENGKTVYTSNKLDPKLKAAIMVPDFFLSTKASRGALPDDVPLADASYNISRASLLTSALINGKYDDLKPCVSDKLHQDIRKENVPHFDEIMEKSYEMGAKATYLSGSGPTIVSLISENYDEFEKNMSEFLETLDSKFSIKICSIDNVGAILKECAD
ncbi:MAG: homoserine kinase [Clostridia bacterium]|nr:homoserine kinase [Clostridia bacterium]